MDQRAALLGRGPFLPQQERNVAAVAHAQTQQMLDPLIEFA